MNSRRDFLKQAAALGATGLLPASIQRALAIDPAPGSTWQDAEHVVILMQENRSFDHCFGTLRGVRGFGDPRAITLPDGLPVWLQTNAAGETHAPFPLRLTETKSTWMQSLPHSWADQTAARRHGHHDRWLTAKAPGHRAYAHLPMTLGYYTRDDLPFYHALADAFTICDQNFCSSLTGTTPNRLHLWTGTIRPAPHPDSPACLRNSDVDYDREATWTTFPERLETLGIPWRVYQNELSLPTGLTDEESAWLANFTDNPLEWFTQYGVRFSPANHAWLKSQEAALTKLADQAGTTRTPAESAKIRQQLAETRAALARWSPEAFAASPPREQALHRRAFTTNAGDKAWHRLESLEYQNHGTSQRMDVPAGDVHHQFRQDVREGKLPAVSWLVAPQHFSDHPESPWYGAWYLAEVFDILTKNPDVWRKTIFILCYDENDGWFDHAPPPTAPAPGRPETGGTSPGLAAELEYITAAQEAVWRQKNPKGALAEGPIGLGYRVPLLIASPWSRGGAVASQVFDHTSIVQFLETWLSHKTGREVRETNITPWRRAVCGDLTSVFQPWQGEPTPLPPPVERTAWLGSLHQAQFKPLPGTPPLSPDEILTARRSPRALARLPRQEPGLRPSRALPYELSVQAEISQDRQLFSLTFAAGNTRHGARSAGAVFQVYAPPPPGEPAGHPEILPRAYTVAPGSEVRGSWLFADFPGGRCRLQVHGPNGFFRSWQSAAADPDLTVILVENTPATPRHQLTLTIRARRLSQPLTLRLDDPTYGQPSKTLTLKPDAGGEATAVLPCDYRSSHGWHHLRLILVEFPGFEHQLAGRLEDGLPGWSDPALG
jgi:phospholipase C